MARLITIVAALIGTLLLALLAFGLYGLLLDVAYGFTEEPTETQEQRRGTLKPPTNTLPRRRDTLTAPTDTDTLPPPRFNLARFGFQGSRLDFALGLTKARPDIDAPRHPQGDVQDGDLLVTPGDDEHRALMLSKCLALAKANGLNHRQLDWIETRFWMHYNKYTVFDTKEQIALQRDVERDARYRPLFETKEGREDRQRILARLNAAEEGYETQDIICNNYSYQCFCPRPHRDKYSPSSHVKAQIHARIAEQKALEAAAAEAERARHRRQLLEEKKKAEREAEAKAQDAKSINRRVLEQKLIRLPSQKYMDKISEAMRRPVGTPLCRVGGDTLDKHSFEKLLKTQGWLDDKAIMSYLNVVCDLVNERAGTTKATKLPPKVFAVDSLVYTRWLEAFKSGKNVGAVPNGLKRGARIGNDPTKLLEVETLLVPVNSNAHWTLLVISPKAKKIEYIDSFRSSNRVPTMVARKFLETFLGGAYNAKEWVEVETISPRQRNTWDCGVFVCTNAECIASGVSIDCYDENELPEQRSRIAAVLMNEGFGGDLRCAIDM